MDAEPPRRWQAMTAQRGARSIVEWNLYSRAWAVRRPWRHLRPRRRPPAKVYGPATVPLPLAVHLPAAVPPVPVRLPAVPRAPGSGRRRQQCPQAADRPRLDLADALGRDAIFVGELVQRGLVFGHPAALQNRATAIVEPRECRAELLGGAAVPLLALGLLSRVCIGRRQIGRRAVALVLIAVAARVVEGQIARREPALHLRDLRGADPEVLGDRARLVSAQPGEVLLQPTQIEEQLALRLSRSNLDQPPVAQHVLVYLRANPVHGKGDQP